MELTDKIRRVYLPMTETGFYILFCLQKENHGYGITQKVKEMTDSQVSIRERAIHQHPTSNTHHLSDHQHLTLNTHHPILRSLKLAKEASIVLREEAEVAYTVLEVSNTLNTHTEGITCIYA